MRPPFKTLNFLLGIPMKNTVGIVGGDAKMELFFGITRPTVLLRVSLKKFKIAISPGLKRYIPLNQFEILTRKWPFKR